MTAPWWELRLSIAEPLADDAGALLIAAGALGVEVLSASAPPPRLPGGSEPPPLPVAGTAVLLVSYDGDLAETEVASLAEDGLTELGDAPAFSLTRRADTDWAERWKQYFKPMRFGERVWVVPSWERDFEKPQGALVIEMDPGLAFGTGQHATTALCLEVLDSHLPRGATVIDVGSGSGVLAIAAALLGAGRTLAIDNDPLAVRVSAENIAQNHVDKTVRASSDDVADVTETFDWVLANIIAPVLIELMRPLIERAKPGGVLLLSGILLEQAAEVEAAVHKVSTELGRSGPKKLDERKRDNWVAVAFQL